MNKRLFYLLVTLMSVSLIGIIFVQGYWINNTVSINEQQFSFNANQIALKSAEKIELRELGLYYFAFKRFADSLKNNGDNFTFNDILSNDGFNRRNKDFIDTNSIPDDNKLFSPLLISNLDSLQFKKIINNQASKLDEESEVRDLAFSNGNLQELLTMDPFEREYLRQEVLKFGSKNPIHIRVPKNTIRSVISQELQSHDFGEEFEYAIYSNSLSTKVKSEDFELKSNSTYAVPIFNEDVENEYYLYLNFPQKNKYILGSITLLSIMSIIFTLIIVVAYTSALSQLIRQKQISEIKTDFINNMTHEFKTPIATTKLALDFLKNPKARTNEDILTRYLGMIREENERMNVQVENILQISRLEKSELNMVKEPYSVHGIIDKAINHLSLLVTDRDGYMKTHFGALQDTVLANESHLTNVFVNILDNANKYSNDAPKIDIYTENIKNTISIKIRDRGVGMSPKTVKNIFSKFYRAHTGDVHDIKGHGLGLSYVKHIVTEHHGEISVRSDVGIGSTFIIKLPTINT